MIRAIGLAAALAAGAANAQPAPPSVRPPPAQAPQTDDSALDFVSAPIQEVSSTTRHTATVNGRKVDYTAVAGTLTLRDDAGTATASMFYVAYLLEPNDARRPVTFFYNGGPGSSSMWLHMASFGPRRVVIDTPHMSANAPHRLVDNDATVLTKTDIVFLDAINTGYSRPLGDTKPEAFLTADADIDAFTKGIMRFLTVHQRWNSPKYLFGESYGTSRSAGVAARLQAEGAQLNGLIQLGSILDIARILAEGDAMYKSVLPTYAMTAAYHGRIAKPQDQAVFIREVTDWVEGPYSVALAKGDALPSQERRQLAEQMSKYIGLPASYLVEQNLRVTPDEFRAQLLHDQGEVIGELDTRFTALEVNGKADEPSFDPSASGVFRPIIATFQTYVRDELNFKTPMVYRRAFAGAFPKFDFRRTNGAGLAQYGPDLAVAMKINPNLKVLSFNGLYDLSTAFYGAQLDYAHLGLPAQFLPNIRQLYYGSGHMAYVDGPVARSMSQEMQRFYDETAPAR